MLRINKTNLLLIDRKYEENHYKKNITKRT